MAKQYRVGCKGLDEFGKGNIIFNNKAFAVPYFLPGEKGEIELVYRAKDTKARLVSLDKVSENRITPPCHVYERCGGCQLMHMKYEAQLKFKQSQIEELFPEEAGQGKILPIISMENPYHYRHKIYASFAKGAKGDIYGGIYEENSHRVVRVKNCNIQNETANRILETVTALMKRKKISPYREDQGTGILRHVYIRVGKYTGQVMVVLVTGSREFPGKNQFVGELCRLHPEITTVIHNINDKKTSMVLGTKETVLVGNGYVEDILCGYTFRISSQSFYQVNPEQTERLYETAISFAQLTGSETILDAYCGIGTIAMVASKKAGKVVGVELNSKAVQDARENAVRNGCRNIEFICGDAGEFMAGSALQPDVVFMDPPRSGSDQKFLSSLVKTAPKKIVYISCNPRTQKADVDFLKKKGYCVQRLQAVDCFCQSYHIECVVLMSRIDKA